MTLLCNADMGPAQVREYCKLDDAGKSLLLASRHLSGGSALGPAGRDASVLSSRDRASSHAATGHERAPSTASLRFAQGRPQAGTHHRGPFDRLRASLEGVAEIKTHHLAEAIQ